MYQNVRSEAQKLSEIDRDCVKLRENNLLKHVSPFSARQRALEKMMKKHFEESDAFERVADEAAKLKTARTNPTDIFQPMLPRPMVTFNDFPAEARNLIQMLPPEHRQEAMLQIQGLANAPNPTQYDDEEDYLDPDDILGVDDPNDEANYYEDMDDPPEDSHGSNPTTGQPSESDTTDLRHNFPSDSEDSRRGNDQY